MRAIIVTVYNSSNYGAFLQAKALQKFIENECNLEVRFLKTGARKSGVKVVYDTCLMLKAGTFHWKTLLFNIKKEYYFKKNIVDFPVEKITNIQDGDCCIFGSDEIWNIKKKAFYFFPIFWGCGIHKNVHKISYAPSINNTTEKQIRAYRKGVEGLKTFSRISVRDNYSAKVMSSITKKEIEVVLDPTLLQEKDFYNEIEEEIEEKNYILIYSYGTSFTKQNIREIRNISEKENLEIISVGNFLPWCDKCILCSPGQFLRYVRDAKYCFTDTFHGTIFSLIYHKKVGVFAGKARKVQELLELLNMKTCIVQEEESMYDVIKKEYDYFSMEETLMSLREKSKKFIKESLELL